jgi:hypothetical protein
MVTREDLREQIQAHLDGLVRLEDLSAWAEEVFRTEEFEEPHDDQISDVLAFLRDATDPHRFRWEEPDLEKLVEELEEE